MPQHHPTAVPRDFFCEHTASKSRVLALVGHQDGPDSLQAVLTCRDPELAQSAAELLRALRSRSRTPLEERVEDLCARLPDALAASFRHAVAHTRAGTWPAAAASVFNWPEHPHGFDGRRPADDQETRLDDAEGDETDGRADRTPHDARLRDLAGPVVRLAVLREFHVHDRTALLDAATDQGWRPLPAEELDEDDPHDVVGAVMWLADSGAEIEGADSLLDLGKAHRLRSAEGHEVAQWSPEPIVEDFGKGWLHRAEVQSGDSHRPEERVDFAALFAAEPLHCEDPECEDEGCLWQLTPRTADLLHTALTVLADEAYDDAEELGDNRLVQDDHEGNWGVFARMPKLTFAADLQWRRRFARAADDLADDLEHGRWPQPTCTAEELALHFALEDARDLREELGDTDDADHAALPVHRDDYDFDACTDMFFQDTDVLMLYDARFDGIEDPDGETNRQIGMGDLRAEAWFDPFGDVQTRDPHRGFRR
ncbi:hypothetical protein [Kitasatospora sp. NPDC057541]|uniref:hypothetical protein n=1 Tax=unclassified Kitasatospora TaxID=2633591 RepID=UPI0036CD9804